MRKINLLLPITPTSKMVFTTICVKQFDHETNALIVDIYGLDAALTTETARIDCYKPDGNVVSISGSINEKSQIIFDIVDQMTVVSGDVRCEIRITKSSNQVATATFILRVLPAVIDGSEPTSKSVIPLLYDIAERAENSAAEAKSSASAAKSSEDVVNYHVNRLTNALTVDIISSAIESTDEISV